MARWKLIGKHYLKIPNTYWERVETSRETGRQAIVRFEVPTFLDPDDPSCCNYRDYEGEGPAIIVCHKGKGKPRDLEFEGPPTPDMLPIDEEAEAISAPLQKIWKASHPIDSLGGTYADAMIQDMQRQMDVIMSREGQAIGPAVSVQQFNELKAMVESLVKENTQLKAGRRL